MKSHKGPLYHQSYTRSTAPILSKATDRQETTRQGLDS